MIAPAGSVDRQALEAGIAAIRAEGFEVEVAGNIFQSNGYLAGAAELRARDLLEFFERPSGPDPYSVHRKLQDTMQSLVGIFRTEEDLNKGIAAVAQLRREAKTVRVEGSRAFNPGWHLAHDLRNMLIVSEVVARCALQRKESRGAHARIDYPNLDPKFGAVNSSSTLAGEEVRVAQTPLPTMPDELRALFEEPVASVKS